MSDKPLERRINQGVFISGMTGSGKSRMAARCATVWSRVVHVDPMRTFQDADRVTSPRELTDRLRKVWGKREPWRIAVTFASDEEYRAVWASLFALATASKGNAPSVLLNIDEVDLWSSPNKIDPMLQRTLRYGRHYGISWIANCRADVDTHRAVRMNASQVLLFRQGMLSPEMRRAVTSARNLRRPDLLDTRARPPMPEVERLVKHDGAGPAVEGVHYLALPDGWAEWWPTWESLARS